MPKEWQPGTCNEKSGFLFSHDCPRAASSTCAKCEKPVCQKHAHRPKDGATMLCTVCMKKRGSDDDEDHRHEPYPYNDPYYYGSHYYGDQYYGDQYYGDQRYRDRRDDSYSSARREDPSDFTEADSESLVAEADTDFENDMSES